MNDNEIKEGAIVKVQFIKDAKVDEYDFDGVVINTVRSGLIVLPIDLRKHLFMSALNSIDWHIELDYLMQNKRVKITLINDLYF